MKQEPSKFQDVHWADNSAKRVLEVFPNEKIYTVASGVTPSGIIHVGHFREIITSELVRRALEKKGKKTHFIYSWDSYDAFRKVPKNIPSTWEKHLRLPDASVPDPEECHESFAEHYMQTAEESLEVFGFPIIFQRQHELQTSGIYAQGIKKYLTSRDKIKPILDKFRKEPLPSSWIPITIYCERCNKDTTKVLSYDEEYTFEYKCDCGNEDKVNFKEKPIVKLPWRLDWPMRWDYFKVSFEPGGKDHSTPGGSYDTGKDIVKLVSNREAPVYTFYNFVSMKGMGGKISSSKGDGATISDVLKVYTPELVLFLFAGTRPNAEFDISFDLDVIKIYEDFDKLERIYYGVEEEKNEKKLETLKRTYELSQNKGIEPQKNIPFQPSFRHLSTVAQSNDFHFDKVKEFYGKEVNTDFDLNRLKERFECVRNWLEIYAPEDMRFSMNKIVPSDIVSKLTKNEKAAILELRGVISNIEDSKELVSKLKEIIEKHSLEGKEFFTLMYNIILNSDKGPRLAGFIFENKSKVLDLLNQI